MKLDQVITDSGTLPLLHSLKQHPGWGLFVERLNDAVVVDLNQLRKYPAADIRFLQGEIQGMEAAVTLLDAMILEQEQAIERKRQEEIRQMQTEYQERSQTPYA